MTERRPVYSAKTARQQIGYIKDDEAFDLFDRPCAVYDGSTGLLRDPKNNTVVGYVSLADIVVGSSLIAQDLFSETGPVPPQASLEGLEHEDSSASVCEAEHCKTENVDPVDVIVQPPPSHCTAETDLSVVPTVMHSEKASAEDHASHATDIAVFASSLQKDEVVGSALPPPTGPHLEALSIEQPARPQDASDAGQHFASGEPGSDYPSRTMGDTPPALQPDVDGGVLMPAPSDESAFEMAQPGEPSGGDRMPPAVEAFMRHLTEFLHSSNYQTGTQSSDDAAELEVNPSTEIHKDTDRTPFPSEPDLEGEFSRSGQH